ncbi:hypothetical protein P7K49_006404, partial [Saguinus oedipus]
TKRPVGSSRQVFHPHIPPAGARAQAPRARERGTGGAPVLSPRGSVVLEAGPGRAGRGVDLRLRPARPCSFAPQPLLPRPAMERPSLRALLLGSAGLLLLLLPLSSSSSSDTCGPCEPAACPPLPPLGCLLGETRDACGCCPMCARGEGEPCGGGGAGRGYCAPGMECVKSRKRRKGVSGVCVCKSRYPVCGSDGTTYPSGCQLRAASQRAESRGEKAITQGTSDGASAAASPRCFHRDSPAGIRGGRWEGKMVGDASPSPFWWF